MTRLARFPKKLASGLGCAVTERPSQSRQPPRRFGRWVAQRLFCPQTVSSPKSMARLDLSKAAQGLRLRPFRGVPTSCTSWHCPTVHFSSSNRTAGVSVSFPPKTIRDSPVHKTTCSPLRPGRHSEVPSCRASAAVFCRPVRRRVHGRPTCAERHVDYLARKFT